MSDVAAAERCPNCGSRLSDEPWAAGLCLPCLAALAEDSPSAVEEVDAAAGAAADLPTLELPQGSLSPGQVLGNRYRVRSLLGRGGMGEVWRAFDLKLRVDVALKAVLPQLLSHQHALEALRQEVRLARQVVSPSVCRIFDLVEVEGLELVSMEYIDGVALIDTLRMRSPLALTEAREIAAQFLAGLEAIHAAGLVHRDVKPENVMTTRSGRVVVMDFGVAKGLAEGRTGTVSGTPGYMAPEQARGEAVDARADVFSAGVVLAEMIAPGGISIPEKRAKVWEGIHRLPPQLPESPWAPVLRKAVAQQAADRFVSASALARALEEVTLRVDAGDERRPYPGLAAFTADDAEFFFGRELEVEELWKKLRRPHLMGLIGPSGAGKSSFLAAGLLPVMPTGWRAAVAKPGSRPFTALGQALVPELAGDAEAMKELLRFEEPDVAVAVVERWRRRHDQVLIVVDQFEELFTLNPPEVQSRFAELLARLALEADAHVLLSMRDDFLFHCSSQSALVPMFSELTPLRPPSGAALRRAVVQPALRCGYRFEDDSLVEEMVSEVAHERGALPLLAFAAARLWELRDRERGLLTREAYEHVGGVGGALAQHAEATLERVGQQRLPLVRQLFRNLVTAQGTRAAREREDLLSVFDAGEDTAGDERAAAVEVLDALIDARLLTSYELPTEEDEAGEGRQRIEIIHESLLANWPRLVRWRAQDEEGAVLRDQLRQAAQIWEERGRPEDLLWTGTSFKEYELWRERYGGGISSQEEAFSGAMVAKARRNRRRRRLALTAVIAALGIGLAVVAGLWRSAEESRRAAEAEARRAEASKLLALAQLELENFPTGALAYATKSLELADSAEARRFSLGVLWRGPVARILPVSGLYEAVFSPDGDWLAVNGAEARLVSSTGETSEGFGTRHAGFTHRISFSTTGEHFFRLVGNPPQMALERWKVPGLEELPPLQFGDSWVELPTADGLYVFHPIQGETGTYDVELLPSPPFPRKIPSALSLARMTGLPEIGWGMDPAGGQLLVRKGSELQLREIGPAKRSTVRRVTHPEGNLRWISLSPDSSRLVTSVRGIDRLFVWDLAGDLRRPIAIVEGNTDPDPLAFPALSHDNSRLVTASTSAAAVYLWDLQVPLDRRPLVLRKKDGGDGYHGVFHPTGRWLSSIHGTDAAVWFLGSPWAKRVSPESDEAFSWIGDIAFSTDSNWLAACSNASGMHLWPLRSEIGEDRVVPNGCISLAFDPSSPRVVSGHGNLEVRDAETWEPIGGAELDTAAWSTGIAIDPEGRYVATKHPSFSQHADEVRLIVWNSESGEIRELGPLADCLGSEDWNGTDCAVWSLGFDSSGRLWTGGPNGLRRWNVESGEAEWILGPDPNLETGIHLSAQGRFALIGLHTTAENEPIRTRWLWRDLERGEERAVDGFPATGVWTAGLDASGQIAAVGTEEGTVWIGRVSGGGRQMLVGHHERVIDLEFSPDGRWLASATNGEILLWPVPDLERIPFHERPLAELLATLHDLTNVRVVEDAESKTGWKLEVGPFPGWKDSPVW